jgi:hypothetical protein
MSFWYLCAFIWFKNIEKTLLQMTSGFLQLESTLSVDEVLPVAFALFHHWFVGNVAPISCNAA